MYATVKGGAEAIEAAHRLLAHQRRGDRAIPALDVNAIREQLGLAVDRVMTEGSLYAPNLAALAIKQAQGDLVEAAYLIRAYRATLPRLGAAEPLDVSHATLRRHISTTYKNVPGGQLLGATYDYTHRLLEFALLGDEEPPAAPEPRSAAKPRSAPDAERQAQAATPPHAELIESSTETVGAEPVDITRRPLAFPATRDARLQALARGDEGFLAGIAYSTMRGFGRAHPFLSTLKLADVVVEFHVAEVGETVSIGEISVTECVVLNKRLGKAEADDTPRFLKGYGLAFGRNERKAMAMAVLDITLRTKELGDDVAYPAQDEEFVMMHLDNIDASGMIQHLKLPHYVDFQAEVQSLDSLRANRTLQEEDEIEPMMAGGRR
jgi:alpha-D-ribose 1-methylphosphonate 5-triphosphate synthase subunit PhnI